MDGEQRERGAPLAGDQDTDALKQLYLAFYEKERFVRVKADDAIPTTRDVFDTNFCDIAVRAVDGTAVVISCIDNLIKGAAGQAVQNMNIMLGLDETAGLL